MASTTQDKLYETFVAVSGQQDSNLGGTLDSGEEIAASLSDTVKQLGNSREHRSAARERQQQFLREHNQRRRHHGRGDRKHSSGERA